MVTGMSGIVTVDAAPPAGVLPDRIAFASADGHTTLVGYVFKPEGPASARRAAVVMMHGRSGAYSSAANGGYDATTLSKRNQKWARIRTELSPRAMGSLRNSLLPLDEANIER
jgi:carboxymethylenebutenolidase